MRLQLPGRASSTSIIHPVQLQPLNSPHTHMHAPFPFNHGLTPCCHCYKSLALFIGGRPKIWATITQKEATPFKGCCIIQPHTDCLVWEEGDECCWAPSLHLSASVFPHLQRGVERSSFTKACFCTCAVKHELFSSARSLKIMYPVWLIAERMRCVAPVHLWRLHDRERSVSLLFHSARRSGQTSATIQNNSLINFIAYSESSFCLILKV